MTADTYTYVPSAFQESDALCRRFVELVLEKMGEQFELQRVDPEDDIERIENKARSGFFPFTEGGWRAMPYQSLGFASGPGKHAGLLSAEIEQAQESARKEYQSEHGTDPWAFNVRTPSETREAWYEYESEWMDTQFYIDIRATYFDENNSRSQSGCDEVMFAVFINFDEYGRDKGSIELWEHTELAADVYDLDIEALATEACDVACLLNAKPK